MIYDILNSYWPERLVLLKTNLNYINGLTLISV